MAGGGAARSRTVTGLGDFTSYTWEVRAENDVGFGPAARPVTLTVYNTAGQVVARLVRGVWLDAGPHVREWDGRDDHGRAAASGLYLYRLIAAEGVRVGKLALIR